MNAVYVRKPSVLTLPLLLIKEHLVERDPMNAMHMERPLTLLHHFINIREFILVKNPLTAMNVGSPLDAALTLLDIIDSIVENAKNKKQKVKLLILLVPTPCQYFGLSVFKNLAISVCIW